MAPGTSLSIALVGMFVLAGLAPLLARRLQRDTGYVLAVGFAAAATLIGLQIPAVLSGEPVSVSLPWVPAAGIRFTLVLDGLGLLFALLVCSVGSLVMAYSARYFKVGGSPGRLYGLLTLFAASMLGLVVAGDLILLFIFWELTSITSFFLIGGEGSPAAAKGATRALLVTGLGGLALLAGLILLGIAAGSFDLTAILADPGPVTAHPLAGAAMALVIVGCFTKSAQVPFHFWLPGAMVAPTPVSTYLHAATMVKAGIYLLARLSPVFGGEPAWFYTLVLVGLATAVFGAFMALKQYDLKALLAYSTVSQLGFIVALVGLGTPHAMAAASVHIVAHAAYKATLFMVVGIIDVEAGSRDLRDLSGLRKAMPITAAITGLAALSMAGFPPFLGFVSKEEAFAAFLASPGAAWMTPVAAGSALLAAIMTFGYGARIFDGAFEGPLKQNLYEPSRLFLLPAGITALAGITLGSLAPALDGFMNAATSDALGRDAHVNLHLWHGFTGALLLSAITVVVGLAIFFARRRIDRITDAMRFPVSGEMGFDRIQNGAVRLGERVGAPFLATAPASHFLWVLAAVAAVAVASWSALGIFPADPGPPTRTEDLVVLAALAMACVAVVTATQRMAAVATLGIAGFLVAILYVLFGAPDLALTQLLIETLTVTLVVLVFRKLRPSFKRVAARRRLGAAAAGLGLGALAGYGTWLLTGHRPLSDAGAYYLDAAPAEAGGSNVVNTILVDFRALDTLGEITVLAVAAIGVYCLVTAGRRRT